MKEIKLLEVYADSYCSHSTIHGYYSDIEILVKNFLESEHIRNRVQCDASNAIGYGEDNIKINQYFKDCKLHIEYEKDEKDIYKGRKVYNLYLWVTDCYYETYEEIIIPEVKEEGKTYVPERKEKKPIKKIELNRDLYCKEIVVEEKIIKYDGIPQTYGEVK